MLINFPETSRNFIINSNSYHAEIPGDAILSSQCSMASNYPVFWNRSFTCFLEPSLFISETNICFYNSFNNGYFRMAELYLAQTVQILHFLKINTTSSGICSLMVHSINCHPKHFCLKLKYLISLWIKYKASNPTACHCLIWYLLITNLSLQEIYEFTTQDTIVFYKAQVLF